MTQYDDVHTPAIAVVGLIGAILVFAIIVLLTVVFYAAEARQRYEKDISVPPAEITRLVADGQGRLVSRGWVDRKQGIVYIQITRAMDLVVDEIGKDPTAAQIEAPADKAPPEEPGESQEEPAPPKSDTPPEKTDAK